MSYYFKTAAMSLLSKTLQTFLSKYLSDVDVEGVALPSVYDGSGWGVRLSNVQLREGVELMKTMPGTVTKKRKRKRRIRKHVRRRHTAGAAGTNGGISKDILTDDDGDNNNSNNNLESLNEKDTTISPKGSGSDELSGEFYTSEDDEYDSDGVARPTTPAQASKGMFSCFYNSSRTTKKVSGSSMQQQEQEHQEERKPALQKRNSEPIQAPLEKEDASTQPPKHSSPVPKRQLSAPVTSLETASSMKIMDQLPVPPLDVDD